jgi:hypothetical protein
MSNKPVEHFSIDALRRKAIRFTGSVDDLLHYYTPRKMIDIAKGGNAVEEQSLTGQQKSARADEANALPGKG